MRPVPADQPVVPMCWRTGSATTVLQHRGDAGSWQELRDLDAPAAGRCVDPSLLEPVPASPVTLSLSFNEAEMARACAAAADSARTEVMLTASQVTERSRLRLLQEVADEVRNLDERLRLDAAAARREFVAVARTVAAALTFRQDADRLAELAATVEAMVQAVPNDASLILELAPINLEAMRAYLGDLPVKLVGAALGPLDARLSWRDGWLEHLRANLEAGIDEALACAATSGGEPDLEP